MFKTYNNNECTVTDKIRAENPTVKLSSLRYKYYSGENTKKSLEKSRINPIKQFYWYAGVFWKVLTQN